MAHHFGRIDTYFANILSPEPYAGRRLMNLTGSFGKAILWFHPDGATLPQNGKRSGQNVFDVYYHQRDWQALIDLLRNESPVHFAYSEPSNAAQIYTGAEPVGDAEAGIG